MRSAPSFIDTLEPRTLLSSSMPDNTRPDLADLAIRDGVLYVTGTHKNDKITVSRNDPSKPIALPADGTIYSVAPYGPNDLIIEGSFFIIQTAKNTYYIGDDGVRSVRLNGGAGDDVLRVSKNLKIRAEILGGPGNDRLEAARSNNILRGGSGDDFLIAANGPARYYQGGEGRDTLWGDFRVSNPFTPLQTYGIEVWALPADIG